MNVIKVVIIIVILGVLFLFLTPKPIMDWMIGLGAHRGTYLKYVSNTGEMYHRNYDHRSYDGSRISNSIRKGETTLYGYNVDDAEKYIDANTFQPCQVINSGRHGNYSMFTSSVGNIVNKLLDTNDKSSLRIGVMIDMRQHLDNDTEFGNYLRLAGYEVDRNDTLETICKKHNDAVKKVQQDKTRLYMTAYESSKLGTYYDYVFNSWRGLSRITIPNGTVLTRTDTIVDKKEILDFYNVPNKFMVIMDYFNGKYVITRLRPLPKF